MTERQKTYFDLSIGGKPAGRVVFEVYSDVTPKTAENFVRLCAGDAGECRTKPGVPLCYQGSLFHRVIKGFMCQFGDFTNGDGTGGESIYGEKFEDENFARKHDRPFLLSMANAGPNTNGSQCFITCAPTPHLDGKHVVFGEVIQGKRVVRAIERQETAADRPLADVRIDACGILPASYEVPADAEATPADEYGDDYEETLADDAKVDLADPRSVIRAVEAVKAIGTAQLQAARFDVAVQKYAKAAGFLQEYFPDDLPDADVAALEQLKVAVHLNLALAALKAGNHQRVLSAASEVLHGAADDKAKAKALYRRGLAYHHLKDPEMALTDLELAATYQPGDAGIAQAIVNARALKQKLREQQKKALSKMFS
ncbi:ADR087Cp [Eremothecium gossypii ATCC 10895]|uniref:Peptidyl-prolyl cis-trans isomerase D n=1 Tax=Eremothecium gossypii (strain ATCC 10895 / CBS 109.51 / FGSC 9923 / NRRL Y-1056) TaxID=284811 RepID=PPID_EREGS|nr:ADR087Cp [Eremothecium gossypii ATCC 10895]Q75A33.1 RecName: Full=Peptidyl-prolyl cis-trans isomerase D; Short=PPIase D; AltName: Full=Rotamase D [Eremothecium gossypii ATCC 10895]AAS52007.1 ADR087Cp [Eremothecium gossypii ATCC 10895]